MNRWLRIAFLASLWVALLVVAVGFAPAGDGRDGERVLAFFALQGEPLAVATFNALGLWPLAFGAVLLRDPPQRASSWVFVGLSFFVGNFALLPGLCLRRWGSPARRSPGLVRRLLTGPAMGALVGLGAVGLLAYALAAGSPEGFIELAGRSPLVFVMSFDFASLVLTWPVLLHDDARRHPGPMWRVIVGWIPLLGPPLWLLVRGRADAEPGPTAA